jgi:hypothetical protein
LLSLTYIERDYEFVYCDDIDEAESVFANDKKQIFILDDFLGSNFLDTFTKKEESKILRFIDRISAHSDKLLILNSRTTIYKQASQLGIHWTHKNWSVNKFHLDIQNYKLVDRAKILYNHLSFRGIDQEYFDAVKHENSFMPIINHKNFNPRIIEFITSKDRLHCVAPKDYIETIRRTLDNPSEIWKPAYLNQISDTQRWLLQTLYAFKGEAKESELKRAFDSRLEFEVSVNGQKRNENSFNSALEGLLDGFICREIKEPGLASRTIHWKFLNPSIFDFLNALIIDNPDVITATAKSAKYFKQLDVLFQIPKIKATLIENGFPALILNGRENLLSNKHDSTEFDIFDLFRKHSIPLDNRIQLELTSAACMKCNSQADLHSLLREIDELYISDNFDQFIINTNGALDFIRSLIMISDCVEDLTDITDKVVNRIDESECIISSISNDSDINDKVAEILDGEESIILENDEKIYNLFEPWQIQEHADKLRESLSSVIEALGWVDQKLSDSLFKLDYERYASKNMERSSGSDENDERSGSLGSQYESLDDICHVFIN